METGAITSHIDVAQVVLYAFWIFFLGLVLYLRYEDQREGYPLENEKGPTKPGYFYPPAPKNYKIGEDSTRSSNRPERKDLNYATQGWFIGDAVLPKGDPIAAGVGPGSWCERTDVADVTFEGHNRIVPTRVAPEYGVEEPDVDPRGFPVVGSDSRVAGTVVDLWIDRAEFIFRYLEVELSDGSGAPGRRVLLPFGFADVNGGRKQVSVDSIRGNQFGGVPGLRDPDAVTRLEEDKIVGYFGGGYLYSSPHRAEPIA